MNRNQWLEFKEKNEFKKFNWPTYAVIFLDMLLVFISWKLSFYTFPLVILSYLLLVVALLHFYLILHEATHNAISKHKLINDTIGQLSGLIVVLPYLSRQTSHILHHAWVGHPKRDPANERLIERFSVITDKQVRKIEFIWRYWIPALVLNDRIGLWLTPFLKQRIKIKPARLKLEKASSLIYIFIYLTLFILLFQLSFLAHFFYWYLPALVCALFLEELVNLPHHAETPLLNYDDKALPYWEQYKVTHGCRSIPFWSKYIILNFNLHIAHHAFPSEPWHNLDLLNNKMRQMDLDYVLEKQTANEIGWSWKNRKRSLIEIMGHYFDKTNKSPAH